MPLYHLFLEILTRWHYSLNGQRLGWFIWIDWEGSKVWSVKAMNTNLFFWLLTGFFAFLSDFRDTEQTMYLQTQYSCFYTRKNNFSTILNSLNFAQWRYTNQWSFREVVLLLVENWIPIPRLEDVKYQPSCQFLMVLLKPILILTPLKYAHVCSCIIYIRICHKQMALASKSTILWP